MQPFTPELINRLEDHDFEPVKVLQWRNSQLDFTSLEALLESLRAFPPSPRLGRARAADDLTALETLCNDDAVKEMAQTPAAVRLLWEACQVPDYRKISETAHADLVQTLYKFIMSPEGLIPEDWLAGQVAQADRTDGDIDTLANRISLIRTWTFVSNRGEWLADPAHWRERTRAIEDTLSDALHELLTQRFVDRRTSVLMKSMRDKDTLYADIENSGQIYVEKHFVGKLEGFHFTPDTSAAGIHGKAARHAAAKILARELTDRAERLDGAKDDAFALSRAGGILWEKQEIGRINASDDPLRPVFMLTADEHLTPVDKDRVNRRVQAWLDNHVETRLKPLNDLAKASDLTGLARGIAFRMVENFGILPRETVSEEIRSLDQNARAELRKFGVRFGAYNIYFPALLKPAAADLVLLLWSLKHGPDHGMDTQNLPTPPRQGLTSVVIDVNLPEAFYRAAGFHICGPRAVRIDMLERLADLIRPLTSWKPSETRPEPPAGAVGRGGFKIQPEMLSIIGCSAEELGNVLFALGFRKERRQVQSKPAEQSVEAVAAESASNGEGNEGGDQQEPAKTEAETAPAAETDDTPATDAAPAEAESAASAAIETPSVVEVAPETEAAPNASAPADTAPAEQIAAQVEANAAIDADTSEAATEINAEAEAELKAEAEVAPSASAEPEYEEIWRPRRRGQHDNRQQSGQRKQRQA
ncbi:MAG: helicase, partial [Alphaproteobacteria bacterium]